MSNARPHCQWTLSYARYCLQVFWPGDLAVYYPFPATFAAWSVAGAALLLLGISVASLWHGPAMAVCVGWLAVVLGDVATGYWLDSTGWLLHADRYTYVPLIGLFVSLVWGAGELVNLWRAQGLPAPRQQSRRRWSPALR